MRRAGSGQRGLFLRRAARQSSRQSAITADDAPAPAKRYNLRQPCHLASAHYGIRRWQIPNLAEAV